jgi:hypothetical protein
MLQHVQDLEARLDSWHQSLDPIYRARAPFKVSLPQGKHLFRMLFLHFSYHVSMIAIHGAFFYPWDRSELQSDKSPEIRAQIHLSTEAVGQSSRQIIMGLQRLETSVTLPLWYESLPELFKFVLRHLLQYRPLMTDWPLAYYGVGKQQVNLLLPPRWSGKSGYLCA